ncbi:ImmA/IrrE family metallo-endopeptidase [uncultured Desulfosarcina sp.]|uniref:ImmA/IrrE family metallo-endopeptidase n=1 Tax=uncultured Desulfosarcina sp. TaxID=218289 RepID=UPI0029C8D2C1|nr:ImmA/IrrE family metallo-endopeptidase [uncultured Desulfosarcina sp.]
MKPRVIKNNKDYEEALQKIESLVVADPLPGTEEAELLDLLSILVEKYESENFPIDLPDPIEAIKFRMNEQGLKQKDLIPIIGSKSKVSEILSGKRQLTISMIRSLNEELGIPVDVLLQEPNKKNQSIFEFSWDKVPVKEMINKGWITVKKSEIKKNYKNILYDFFKPLDGDDFIQVFCRRTFVERSGKSIDRHALLAWVGRVLNREKELELPPYKSGTVTDEFIKETLNFSLSEKGPLQAQKFLHENGVALIIEPHLARTHLDGAAMLSKTERPVIGLTLRYDRIDNYWFNLIHELVHVSRHLKTNEESFIDDLDSGPGKDPREKEADILASEIIIPRRIWKRSDAYRKRTPDAINELSLKLKIHPAIVAGRIRHDARNFYILSQMVGNGMVRKLFTDAIWD